ncbi:hypothetical protein M8S83_23600, partial [Enterobacter asburiae]|uniref:hypothetical protein n=1 Tax=Enterobacter asburiae TaxID=61645 RepID=UPI002075F190
MKMRKNFTVFLILSYPYTTLFAASPTINDTTINAPTEINNENISGEVTVIDGAFYNGGSVNINNTSITNDRNSGTGMGILIKAQATPGSSISLDKVNVNSMYEYGIMLYPDAPGNLLLNISNSDIYGKRIGVDISGANYTGGKTNASVNIKNSTISSEQIGLVVNTEQSDSKTVNIYNSIIKSTSGDAIRTYLGGDRNSSISIDIDDSELISGDGSNVISVNDDSSLTTGGNIEIKLNNSVIQGDILNATSSGFVSFNEMLSQTDWTGAFIVSNDNATSYLSLNNNSVWNVTSDSAVSAIYLDESTLNELNNSVLSTPYIQLNNNSIINGILNKIGTIDIYGDSSWNITGNSDVNNLVVDHSQMTSQNGATLTANNLTLRN